MQPLMHIPLFNLAGNFLDESKAFDKVWQERVIFRFKLIGIYNTLLELIERIYKTDFEKSY